MIDDRVDEPGLAALMIDIDHFKAVNDSFGHAAGDLVLQQVAGVMMRVVRPGDVAVRFGGGDLLVVLAGVDTVPLPSASVKGSGPPSLRRPDPTHV